MQSERKENNRKKRKIFGKKRKRQTYKEDNSPSRSPIYAHPLVPDASIKEMSRLCDVTASYIHTCSYQNVPIKLPVECGK